MVKRLLSLPENVALSIASYASGWQAKRKLLRSEGMILYHYCDANALLNIFDKRKIWATSTRYLNDSTECVSVLKNLLEHKERHTHTREGRLLGKIAETTSRVGANMVGRAVGMENYAACFSEEGDILSQWRSYANDGYGFAIGFDVSRLAVLNDETHEAELVKIGYGGKQEQELIDELFENFGRLIASSIDDFDETDVHFGNKNNEFLSLRFNECLYEMAYCFKHEAFQEEREFRIYARNSDQKFRVSNNKIVPYVELDMCRADNDLMPIAEIVFGPRLNAEDTGRVVMYLAEKYGYGYSGINFRSSNAPYR